MPSHNSLTDAKCLNCLFLNCENADFCFRRLPWPAIKQMTQNLRLIFKCIIFPLDIQITSPYIQKTQEQAKVIGNWKISQIKKQIWSALNILERGDLKRGFFCPCSCHGPFLSPLHLSPTSPIEYVKIHFKTVQNSSRTRQVTETWGAQRYSISCASRWCYFSTWTSQPLATSDSGIAYICFPSSFMLLGCLMIINKLCLHLLFL